MTCYETYYFTSVQTGYLAYLCSQMATAFQHAPIPNSMTIGSFKVTIIYIIIHSIIFLININGVVKEFNNGVINGDFLINGPQGLLLH